MFLDYLALFILLLVVIAVFYAFIYIHDLPYNIAEKRHHPQKEAIHVACWLSLFTLHAIWPIVFIWAVSKQTPLPEVLGGKSKDEPDLGQRLAKIEERLSQLEDKGKKS
jgi:ABC-type uncharacterized transport system YnjBCD permease subunit